MKKDIDIRYIIVGLLFFSLLMFHTLIDSMIYDYQYIEKGRAYDIKVEKFFHNRGTGYVNSFILMPDFKDSLGNSIIDNLEKEDSLIKEKDSFIIKLIKPDSIYYFIWDEDKFPRKGD